MVKPYDRLAAKRETSKTGVDLYRNARELAGCSYGRFICGPRVIRARQEMLQEAGEPRGFVGPQFTLEGTTFYPIFVDILNKEEGVVGINYIGKNEQGTIYDRCVLVTEDGEVLDLYGPSISEEHQYGWAAITLQYNPPSIPPEVFYDAAIGAIVDFLADSPENPTD